MKIELLRTGTHTDMAGRVHTYTDADLDNIVRLYNEQPAAERHVAPLVLGHPKIDGPAYGWIERLGREGDRIYGDAPDESIDSQLRTWIKNKSYRFRSVALYPSGVLRHVGFLGATPPAIKGLADIQLSETDATVEVFEFADAWAWENVSELFRGLREWFIENKDLATADQLVPEWKLQAIADAGKPDPVVETASFADDDAAAGSPEEAQGPQFSNDPAILAELEAARARIAAQEARTRELEAEVAEREIQAFCDSEEMRTRLVPAIRPLAVDLLRMSRAVTEFQFADGESDADTFVRRFLAALPVQVEFSEVAKNGTASEAPADETAEDRGQRIAAAANKTAAPTLK